jgi:hypothetical protein
MYTIDLATLLRLLQEFQRSGILTAELPSGVPGTKEPCHAWVELAEGKMVSCHIKNRVGRNLLTGSKALSILKSLGTLDWSLEVVPRITQKLPSVRVPPITQTLPAMRVPSISQPLPAVQVPPITVSPPVPRRIAQIEQKELNLWPRTHRRVFALIDGNRNVNEIATMLSLSRGVEGVMTVLRDLKATGIIAIED